MSALSELVDPYNRRARLAPALLVMLPVGLYLLPQLAAMTSKPVWVGLAWPVLAVAGVPVLLTNVVRSRGQAVQKRLLVTWDGLPTTQALRHRDSGPPQQRARRRQRLHQVLGITLPTSAQERRDPTAADQSYALAVDQLIARVRAGAAHFPLVREENIGYGFRRNLLGLKPHALTVLGACLATDLALLTGVLPATAIAIPPNDRLVVLLLIAHAAALAGWLAQVRPPWVRKAAEDYTTRLYATLDDPRL